MKDTASIEAYKKRVSIALTEKKVKSPVSVATLKTIAQKTCEVTRMPGGEISLVVCDDNFISDLNRVYRGKNNPTDVLSFPMGCNTDPNAEDFILGDIIISVPTAVAQAADLGSTVEEEFIFLFIHGLLHLLGYTHDHEDDEKVMMEAAKEIQSGIKGNT
jgi:probable rRNA maturation factor